ncbi:archaetidylserine decarboxylase [Hydrogenophaga sp. IBVHS1]|uniref:archaetidylserine decarboxylase n=1 Tax=unclassified Hydrogenophaga TaxID=2610897 RepID=UPI000A2D7F74|nr:archaetidylserine decarboxylase [Hydrogenophaga sp. IBVHS1]OSZ73044.1 phosphatidylserine decarboxylase [Hydrogenophaga sp. IBVHS1]
MSFAVSLQYVFPKRALTVFGGWVANGRWGAITQWIIRRFIRKYRVNMAEAANPDPKAYGSFNEFFTRALRTDARPVANVAFVCPVDGAISQFGVIARDQIYQAKGHTYSTRALVGGDADLAALFDDGAFATIYLSPKDYHRIHMPMDATLRRMIHVPGDLFSVNPATAQGVPGLFARNERVVCVFDMKVGETTLPFVQVLVGATIVGSMATTWHGVVNPPRPDDVREWSYDDAPVHLQQGEEMGRFLLGSTVVLLWPRDTIAFNPDWAPEAAVKMGEPMGDAL